MKKKLKILFLTASVLLNVSLLKAQCYFVDPPPPETNLVNCASANGYLLPPYDTVRLLIIFAEINYNVNPNADPNPTSTEEWPLGLLPTWANSICDAYPPVGNPQGLLTRYYSEASSGGYLVLGDYLIQPNNPDHIFIVDESDILDPTGNYSYYEEALCNVINETMGGNLVTAHGLNDLDYFDYWTCTERFQQKDKHCNTPHKYDNVTVIWRNRLERNNTGGASSGSYGNILGFESETSIDIGSYNKIPIEALRHEFAHLIIGGNAFHSGGGWGEESYWIPITAGWAALGLHNSSIMTWSGWDRQRLNWKAPGNQFNPSARNYDNTAEVNGDLDASNPSHAGFYWLRDFVATGDAIRIKLPNIVPSSDFQQWLWIENHNGFDINNNPFDLFRYQSGNSCVQPCIYGIYMYQQIDRDIRDGTYSEVNDGNSDYLRPVTAEGLYDRILSDSVQNQCVNENYYRPFTINQDFENPLSGGGDQESYAYDKYLNIKPKLNHDETNINFIEESNGNFTYELFFNGHTRHAFTKSGNNRIGIGTNPSSANFMNLVHYDAPAPDEPRNVRKVILNGISVEIVEQDAGGNIMLKIRFDDVDVVNNRRWCADSVVIFPPKAGAIYSLNITNGAKVVLDWSKTATRIENPKFYMGQTLFSDPTMFVCEANSILHVDAVSSMELINCSTLQMTDNSQLIIEPGAELRVKNKSTFLAREGSEIIVKGNGKIIVENGGYICIEEGALVTLTDVDSKIELMGGYHDGVNPDINITPTVNCTGMCDLVTSGLGYVTFNSATFPNDITIDIPIKWSNAVYSFGGDLTIASSGDLIIEEYSEMLFSNSGKIIIEPGGKLTINNSLITSIENCNSHGWQGIEVWGNPLLSQLPNTNQGVLQVINGSTIENAPSAVRLGETVIPNGEGEITYRNGGGIIYATDAIFRNNVTGVVFEEYNNSNWSYFDRCTFETTDILPGNETPQYFVRLNSVTGIDFRGCTLQNTRNNTVPFSLRGNGIYSYNSWFNVDEICVSGTNPCTEYRSTIFSGLNYGIKAYGINLNRTFTVENSVFENSRRGIYVSAIPYPTIARNSFYMSVAPTDGSTHDTLYAIYLDRCTGYTFEENHLNSDQASANSKVAVGAIINQSGDDNNIIYNNHFERLYAGVLAQNENRNRDGSTGLLVKCNLFNLNSFDLTVTTTGGIGTRKSGIAASQGANLPQPDAPAGNRFSWTGPLGTPTDISNTTNSFTYYYHVSFSTPLRPFYYTEETVSPQSVPNAPWLPEESCPPSGGGGGSGETEEMKDRMAASEVKADSLQTLINILKDGGSTEDLKWEVDMSIPPETYQVYNELMNNSPYISDKVMEAAIEKEQVLPNVMIRDVMLANPHNTKNDDLLEKIDQRYEQMPDYMKTQILQGRSMVSAYEKLQSDLSFYRQQRSLAFDALVKHYLTDTIEPTASGDSLMALLESENTLNAHYRLAFVNLHEGNAGNGQSILESIPEQFGLAGDDLEAHQQLDNYYGMLSSWIQEGGTYSMADSLQVVSLTEMAGVPAGIASGYARNVLLSLNKIEYNEPILLPDCLKSSPIVWVFEDQNQSSGVNFSLKVYPIPAGDYLIIEHNLETEPAGAYVEILTANGEHVKQVTVTGRQNWQTVDTRMLPAGMYMATLIADGKQIATVKFTKIN